MTFAMKDYSGYGASLRFDLSDLNIPLDMLADLANMDTRPLLESIGAYQVASTQLNFDAEQSPDGEKWQPSIRAEMQGGKTLQDQGHLRDSITYNVLNDDEVEVGSAMVYALIHQEGGTIQAKGNFLHFKVGNQYVTKKQVDMPARPYLGLGDHDKQEIGDLAIDYIQREAGL